MKITAKKIKARDLKPGDLFSADGEYWENRDPEAVGEMVFIRTGATPSNPDDGDTDVYLITINHDE